MSLEDQFEGLDAEAIDAFIADRQEEHLTLDFKLVNRTDLSHRDDRKNFAKAASGFANSSGGIIVWGVEANDKNPDRLDCASGRQELDNALLFVSKLNEHTGRATSPIVEGIRHKEVVVNGDSGFAVSLIPESLSGPHMAKLGEDRYYKRSGDSFYKMEHFDLEDMFGRRKRPKLRMQASLNRVSTRPHENKVELDILLTIINQGRGSAKSPFLEVFLPDSTREDRFGADGNGSRGLKKISHSQNHRSLRFGSNSDVVIHPGVSLDVTKLETTFRLDDLNIDDIRLEYKIVADGIALQEEVVTFSANEVRDYMLPKIRQ